MRSRSPILLFVLAAAVLLGGLRPAFAQNVSLGWDPSPEAGVTNYVLYASTNSLSATNLSSALVKQSVGTNCTLTLVSVTPALWHFTVTSVSTNGLESVPLPELLALVPRPPANLRTIVLQYGLTVTNFTDLGFFKIKIGSP